ncbi:MAG: ATP-grasp domain-containing protein [Archangium sp.]|nr:ATP-grasp domain-containing protein [Archangium sp.]
MHVVFIEPRFPVNQRYFVKALKEVGATVTAIGEGSKDSLSGDMRQWLTHYEQVDSVVNEGAVLRAAKFIHNKKRIDRIEATVEAHIMSTAKVREAMGIEGTSVKTSWLCRDKPSMKEALRNAGVPCAQSTAASSLEELVAFAKQVGFPLIIKPRDGAGASGTSRCDSLADLAKAASELGVDRGRSVAVEEFIEGHEGFYDTISIGGRVVHEFVTHYYPNVLEAMRHRWISPQFVSTNRVDSAPGYQELKVLGGKVLRALDIGTSATHMEWFSGPKGLKFSEIGCRPPGVRAWDLYNVGNDVDLYREWAMAIVHGRPGARLSRRFAAGIVALRPSQDGRIVGYEGVGKVERAFGQWMIDAHLPPEGTPTQPVSAGYMANAWMRFKHPDYDQLREMLNAVGETVKVYAR